MIPNWRKNSLLSVSGVAGLFSGAHFQPGVRIANLPAPASVKIGDRRAEIAGGV
jgi:hypothetical protein